MKPLGHLGEPMFLPELKLAFDPAHSADPELRAIFEDRIARTLWCAWRAGHIVNQHFNAEVLAWAKIIRERTPVDPDELRDTASVIRAGLDQTNFRCNSLMAFCEQIFPYVSGQAELRVIPATINLNEQ